MLPFTFLLVPFTFLSLCDALSVAHAQHIAQAVYIPCKINVLYLFGIP